MYEKLAILIQAKAEASIICCVRQTNQWTSILSRNFYSITCNVPKFWSENGDRL